jgi:hypothetical protein
MTQIGLPLNWPVDEQAEAFAVSACNRRVVQFLDGWGRWPVAAALLTGPRKSGRTLLARIFAAKTSGTIADNAERWAEDKLFHLWNEAQDQHRPMLIIADSPPPQWRIGLPDLASRLKATPCIALADPDEELVQALFAKLLKQRGLSVSGDVLRFLAARIERSHVNVIRIVDSLDAMALSQNRSITIPLARDALKSVGVMMYEAQPA